MTCTKKRQCSHLFLVIIVWILLMEKAVCCQNLTTFQHNITLSATFISILYHLWWFCNTEQTFSTSVFSDLKFSQTQYINAKTEIFCQKHNILFSVAVEKKIIFFNKYRVVNFPKFSRINFQIFPKEVFLILEIAT